MGKENFSASMATASLKVPCVIVLMIVVIIAMKDVVGLEILEKQWEFSI